VSDFYLEIKDRDFTDYMPDLNLSFEVKAAEWDALGGPKSAKVTVSGPNREIWELLEWLRFEVTLRTHLSERFWWGYVSEVSIKQASSAIKMTLSEMFNNIKVTYSYIPTGSSEVGEQRETDWAGDDDSMATYGIKELIASMDGATQAVAEARRDAILSARKYPQGTFDHDSWAMDAQQLANAGGEEQEPITAELTLAGWWQTLDWQYAEEPPVTGIDNGVWEAPGKAQMGRSTYQKWMQQFTMPASGGTIREITVCVSKIATPTDNLVVEIYALDGSGNPTGSALASESVTGTDLGASYDPGGYFLVTVVLSTGVTLTASTQYGLVISRSGALDATNYYVVNLDTDLSYSGGVAKVWYTHGSPAGWYQPQLVGLESADIPFVLWMDEYVGAGRQMADMIANASEFMTATYFVDASDREQSSFLDGSKTLLEELTAVMAGAGANDRRMLSWVDWDRRLRIYEEPASTTTGYYLDSMGRILDAAREPIGLGELYRVPGTYAEVVGVVPNSVDLTRLMNANLQFIEGVKWSSSNGVKPVFRGQLSLEDLLSGVIERY
jgi:hypothetical protein